MVPTALTSVRKEIVLYIFITLKNQFPSTRFEPANPGSNGKHDNDWVTENDQISHYSESKVIYLWFLLIAKYIKCRNNFLTIDEIYIVHYVAIYSI
jgi:hypothetical protein